MHDKFMAIDDQNVETGSFNYIVSAAWRNAENALLLISVKPLADQVHRAVEPALEWFDPSESKLLTCTPAAGVRPI